MKLNELNSIRIRQKSTATISFFRNIKLLLLHIAVTIESIIKNEKEEKEKYGTCTVQHF